MTEHRKTKRFAGYSDGGFPIYCLPLPSTEDIISAYHFEEETGKFYYRKRNGEPNYRSGPAGSSSPRTSSGYVRIRINNKGYAAHRIIWKLCTGTDPVGIIDHINGVRNDNRIENLRDVSIKDNNQNSVRGRWEKTLREQYLEKKNVSRIKREVKERALLAKLKAKYERIDARAKQITEILDKATSSAGSWPDNPF